ncbi:MAG: mevalonate kinase [Chitinophagales bacterium]|nr:mevalonate kinase [Chitinophagales bacterium]
MSQKQEHSFNSKILLFGEYSIIQDSMGLSLPYEYFNGKLSFDKSELKADFEHESNDHLQKFSKYLEEKIANKQLSVSFDIAGFQKDIQDGMYFQSNIPQGFGIGSSGALVAAIYKKYVATQLSLNEKPSQTEIFQLKADLALMESYFHGSSSGVDPLICYLNLPLLIKGKESIEPVKVALDENGKGAIFLIDTGISRSTEPLVKYYMQKMEEPSFREFVDKQLKPFANNCIQAFLDGDKETLFAYMKLLSKFQFDHFKPMIPKLFNKLWKRGLDSNQYYLKLCGAGGGGFILGFTQNFEQTKKQLKNQPIELLCKI